LPSSYADEQNLSHNRNSVNNSEVTRCGPRRSSISLDTGRLEFDDSGNIRFTTKVSEATRQVVELSYQEATNAINQYLCRDEQPYDVSLVLGGIEDMSCYLKYENELYQFGAQEFDAPDISYTELRDDCVKISFSDKGDRAVV